MIATGHYARIIKDKNEYKLCKGLDHIKDQSYMFGKLKKNIYQKLFYLLGDLTKKI